MTPSGYLQLTGSVRISDWIQALNHLMIRFGDMEIDVNGDLLDDYSGGEEKLVVSVKIKRPPPPGTPCDWVEHIGGSNMDSWKCPKCGQYWLSNRIPYCDCSSPVE